MRNQGYDLHDGVGKTSFSVTTHQIGPRTSHIRDHTSTRTGNFFTSQIPRMMCTSSCHLSVSRAQLYPHLRAQSLVIRDNLCRPWWRANPEGSIHRAQHMPISAKCKSVQLLHPKPAVSLVVLTSASKYFQIFPCPPGALHCTLRRCKSILRLSWKHLPSWRWIQDATWFTIMIVKFWSCWEC
jgi:hypothetical protein